MGHCGKDMTSTNTVMAGLICTLLGSVHVKRHHPTGCRECLQDHQETIQSISQYLPALLLHLNIVLVHLGDTPVASQWKDSGHQRNCGKPMLQGLGTCPHCRIFPTMKMMQTMRAIVCWTWVVQKVYPQSAWSKPNSPWNNLPKEWGKTTSAHSRSGRQYGWLGFRWNIISLLSAAKIISHSFEMYPWTGRQLLQNCSWHSSTAWHWIMLIILNWYSDSGLRWCCGHEQVKFGSRETGEGELLINQWQIWESVWSKRGEVTTQSYQIWHSWLWVAGCRTATIELYPPNDSKPHVEVRCTGWSGLISSTRMGARTWHMFYYW